MRVSNARPTKQSHLLDSGFSLFIGINPANKSYLLVLELHAILTAAGNIRFLKLWGTVKGYLLVLELHAASQCAMICRNARIKRRSTLTMPLSNLPSLPLKDLTASFENKTDAQDSRRLCPPHSNPNLGLGYLITGMLIKSQGKVVARWDRHHRCRTVTRADHQS